MQITARYPGRCARTGQPIKPGDRVEFDPATKATTLVQTVDPADKLDAYMPIHGRGRSRAAMWRQYTNAAYGRGLDHEVE